MRSYRVLCYRSRTLACLNAERLGAAVPTYADERRSTLMVGCRAQLCGFRRIEQLDATPGRAHYSAGSCRVMIALTGGTPWCLAEASCWRPNSWQTPGGPSIQSRLPKRCDRDQSSTPASRPNPAVEF